MKPEFVELIGKEHTLRVLFALRARGPRRFGELQGDMAVNPAQLDRALKWLQERVYVLATTIPRERGPVVVSYDLSKRGAAFLDAFDSFLKSVDSRRSILGEEPVRELEALAG
jgi:DNA-binding HxlR family transcriptional regulator